MPMPACVVPAANGAASGFLRIGLADPVGRQRELLAEFLEGATGVRTDSEAPSQHNLLAWGQGSENLARPFAKIVQASLAAASAGKVNQIWGVTFSHKILDTLPRACFDGF